MLPYNKNLKGYSRQLRQPMTDAERRLWARIRMEHLRGYHFYRQKPVGDYIVDFLCPKAKLVIEVDGSQHFSDDRLEYDRMRDEYLNSLGLRVLRFSNNDVLTNIEGVVERIMENIGEDEKIPLNPPFSKGDKRSKRSGSSLFAKERVREIKKRRPRGAESPLPQERR